MLLYENSETNKLSLIIFFKLTFLMKFIGTTAPIPTTTTTIYLTSALTSSQTSINIQSSTISSNSSAEAQQGDTTPATSSTSNSNDKLWLLFLLIIPVLLLLFFCFICLCGRVCLSSCYGCTSVHCCNCLRPDKTTKEVLDKKPLEAIVIHGESDELWVGKNVKPLFANYKSRAIKLTASNPSLTEEQAENVRQARRVVIVFTRTFLEKEWKNKELQDLLKSVYFNDPYCILVAIVVGDVSPDEFILQIDPSLENPTRAEKIRTSLASRLRRNMGLEHLEVIKWHEEGLVIYLFFNSL